MEERLYTITELAQELDLPISTARYYRDRFKDYLPATRRGNKKLYNEQAREALGIIAEGLRSGKEAARVEEELSGKFDRTIDQGETSLRAAEGQQPSFSLELMAADIASRRQLAESLGALAKQIEEQNKVIYSLVESKQEADREKTKSQELARALEEMNRQRERLLSQEKTEEGLRQLKGEVARLKDRLQDSEENKNRRKWWQWWRK